VGLSSKAGMGYAGPQDRPISYIDLGSAYRALLGESKQAQKMRTCPQDVGAICGKSEERVTAKPHPCLTDWAKRGGRVSLSAIDYRQSTL